MGRKGKGYQRRLRKDGSLGSWRIRLPDPVRGGRYTRTLSPDVPENEVRKIVAALETDLAREAAGIPTPKRIQEPPPAISFAEWAATWLSDTATRRSWQRNTIKAAQVALARAADQFGSRPINELSSSDLATYHSLLIAEGVGESSVRSYYTHLIQCLKDAADVGLIKDIPRYKLPPTSRHAAKRPPQLILQEHYELLIKDAPPAFIAFLVVLWWTGARVTEVLEIREGDLIDGWLTLGIHNDAKKTGKRVIPVAPEAIEALQSCPRRTSQDPKGHRFVPGRIFPVERTRMQAILLKRCAALGLPRYRFKDFRTTWATRARRAGMGLEEAAVYLGHTPTMLLEVYRQVEMEDLEGAIRRLQAVEGLGKEGAGNVIPLRRCGPQVGHKK
jgi:integrase